VYEELLAPLREQRFNLLELGVWKGDSLIMWRDAFTRATIVGLDLNPPKLSLGDRVHVVTGDQGDRALLDAVRAQYAPDGFDIVIDDASHIGELSARSLQALYPHHLKPGGYYVIEDWGTGYMTDWPDGASPRTKVGVERLSELDAAGGEPASAAGSEATRMPSHDAGMVGLVKRLVDHVAAGDLCLHQPGMIDDWLAIEWMRVQHGLAILKKPQPPPA
jgi:hypothetical protein